MPPSKSSGRSPVVLRNSSLLTSMMSPCAHLVRMRVRRQFDLRDDTWAPRVGDIDDRGALGRAHMPDIGPAPLGDDLAAAGNVEPGEVAQQFRHRGILPFFFGPRPDASTPAPAPPCRASA